MIGTSEIQLGKPLLPAELVYGFTNQKQVVSILDCEIVEALIINTQVKTAIKLVIKQCGGTCRRLKRLD